MKRAKRKPRRGLILRPQRTERSFSFYYPSGSVCAGKDCLVNRAYLQELYARGTEPPHPRRTKESQLPVIWNPTGPSGPRDQLQFLRACLA